MVTRWTVYNGRYPRGQRPHSAWPSLPPTVPRGQAWGAAEPRGQKWPVCKEREKFRIIRDPVDRRILSSICKTLWTWTWRTWTSCVVSEMWIGSRSSSGAVETLPAFPFRSGQSRRVTVMSRGAEDTSVLHQKSQTIWESWYQNIKT